MAAALELVDGHALVVNADLPCVTPAALRRLAAAGPGAGRSGGRNDERALAARPVELRAALRIRQRRTVRRHRASPGSRSPSSSGDVDTLDDLERLALPVGSAHAALAESAHARFARAVNVVCLSGGVGGAKLARGLHDVLEPGELTVIGNVGDDVEVLGLHVSPDLDSVLYALAGLNDEERGWGRVGGDLERARVGRGVGRRSRGSGSATATSGSISCEPRRCVQGAPLSAVTAQTRRGRRARHAPRPGDRRRPAHPRRDTGGHVPVPGVVRRARPRETRSTRSSYDGAAAARRRAGRRSRRSPRPTWS